ncbi:hypothetical protein ACBI99_44870 [Nonomuraea sp. ATR24]|uniref:hypothetical protein n=1 Tax=Nonomuraea sp. ATR24 TaxID=1676744 RepID=UPI0035BF2EFB
MSTYMPAAPTRPARTVRAALLPSRHGNQFDTEIVQLYLGDVLAGVATLPPDAAYDLVHRLSDTPPGLSILNAEVVAHVRHVVDREYNADHDRPSDWILSLIVQIEGADEEHRRLLGRGFPAYVVCVGIAQSPGGLDALRRLHADLVAQGARSAESG